MKVFNVTECSEGKHKHLDYVVDVFIPENNQYLIHDSITIDGSATIDGKLVVL